MKHEIQFMKLRGMFFVVSIIVVALALSSIFVLRGFNQGIDFTGGLTANLTINFQETDIGMLRSAFSSVKFQQKTEDGERTEIEVNLGNKISRLEKEKDLDFPSKTYLIRIKNIPGVEKEQVEEALYRILENQFPGKTVLRFDASVSGDPETPQKLLADMLNPLGIQEEDISAAKDGQGLFSVQYSTTNKIVEKEFRNKINEIMIGNQNVKLGEDGVAFYSTIDWGSFNAVSATIGQEMEEYAIILTLVVVFVILLYIAIRFNYKFGIAAVIALVHDVTILLGIISLTGKELNIPMIAAVLTIFGYSINDTIVVFDRIRENLEFSRKEDLPHIVNKSINQSLSRTVITSVTTLLAVFALYLFAGSILRDFSFALIVGILIGTYSSIYIASPVYLMIEGAEMKKEEKENSKDPKGKNAKKGRQNKQGKK